MSERTGRSVAAELVGELAPERRRAAGALLLASGSTLAAIGLAASSAWLIDRAAERPGLTALTAVMCLVQFLAFSKASLRYAERLVSHDLAFRMLGRLRVRVFASLARLAPAGLGSARTGDVLARAVDDVDRLQNLYLSVLPVAATSVVAVAASVACAALLVPAAGGVLAAGLLLDAAVLPALSHLAARRRGPAVVARRAELAAEAVDLLAVAPELAAAGVAGSRLERIAALDRSLRSDQLSLAWRRGVVRAATLLVAGGSLVLVTLLAVGAVHRGALPRVDLAVLPVLCLASFEAVAALPDAVAALPGDLEAGRRVLALEHLASPVSEPAQAEPLVVPAGGAAVALESCTVSYPGAELPALAEVDLAAPAGTTLAVSGPSGSGKSTVAAALLRFVAPSSGRVAVAGHDLATAEGAEVRRVVASLSADDHLFAGSIAANLLLAHPEASAGELWAVLEAVRLAETVRRLPSGLDTEIGEEGDRLSSGERRRLCLARTLLRRGEVLLLDEPTANLDEETADLVLEDALALAAGRTVVVTSHRPADLERADAQLRLVGGRVAATNA